MDCSLGRFLEVFSAAACAFALATVFAAIAIAPLLDLGLPVFFIGIENDRRLHNELDSCACVVALKPIFLHIPGRTPNAGV